MSEVNSGLKTFGIKITQELHVALKEEAKRRETTLQALVVPALEGLVSPVKPETSGDSGRVKALEAEIAALKKELAAKPKIKPSGKSPYAQEDVELPPEEGKDRVARFGPVPPTLFRKPDDLKADREARQARDFSKKSQSGRKEK